MRVLLDTHALLWWLAGDKRLWRPSRCAIVLVSNETVFDAFGVPRVW